MSQYECIWARLKRLPKEEAESRGITITADSRLHVRIIKAVKKRKHIDVGFRFKLGNNSARLSVSKEGANVTFFLTIYLPQRITAEML